MSNADAAHFKAQIVYDDFAKIDIRIGKIVEVQAFPKARNPSYKLAIDLGALGVKWSSAQITSYIADDLIGSQVVCIANFPPRNIAGFMSEVLVLGVEDEKGDVILLSPRSAVPEGNSVY